MVIRAGEGEEVLNGGNMKIAVSSQGNDPASAVDPRFGRARYFIIFDTDNDSWEVVNNEQSLQAAQGAGVKAAEIVCRKGVGMVVSGNLGPKAYAALSESGIKVALWAEGTVAEAIALVKADKLLPAGQANVGGHWL
jgi:predicted Fe-Mo cluster-binding NifX family protein